MPILQEINDPYYASTASTLGGMADGMIGNPAKSQAEAIALANQVQLRRMQQQKLEQEMADAQRKTAWETEDRKRADGLATSAQRYWEVQPVAPVNGTREEMEKFYRTQDYLGQYGAMASRAGKGAEDFGKGLGELNTSVRGMLPRQGAGAPQYPAGVAGNPVAEKKFDEERGKGAAEQMVADEASKVAAAKYLPEMLRARKHYAEAGGYIGQFEGNEWTQGPQNLVGKVVPGVGQGVEKRAALQKEMAAFQGPQIAANNKGLGPMTNYEQGLARLPFAKVDDVNAQVGLNAFDGQLAHTLKTMGYDVPPAHISELMNDLQKQDTQGIQDFIAAHPGGEHVVQLVYEALR